MTSSPDRVIHSLLSAGVLLLWYSITLLITVFPNFDTLQNHGLQIPLMCLLEFVVLVSLYHWYACHHGDIPLGKLCPRQMALFAGLLLLLIASQSLYMQHENWSSEQFYREKSSVLLFTLAVVLLAPVYEEIIFRGFVLRGFLLWAPQQRLACSLLTSLTFAAIHTQYAHPQTLIALTLLSLLLCAARLISGGLKLPIFLHILNNLFGVAPWLWLTLD